MVVVVASYVRHLQVARLIIDVSKKKGKFHPTRLFHELLPLYIHRVFSTSV